MQTKTRGWNQDGPFVFAETLKNETHPSTTILYLLHAGYMLMLIAHWEFHLHKHTNMNHKPFVKGCFELSVEQVMRGLVSASACYVALARFVEARPVVGTIHCKGLNSHPYIAVRFL